MKIFNVHFFLASQSVYFEDRLHLNTIHRSPGSQCIISQAIVKITECYTHYEQYSSRVIINMTSFQKGVQGLDAHT